MNEHDGKCGNFWLGFFLGGLLGAFVIYLLGTKEGKKTLEKIVDRAELYEEELEEKVAKLQQKGEDLLEEAEEIKEKVIQEVTSSKEKISDQLVSKMDAALTQIEDIQKKGVALTEEVHHHYFKKNGKKLIS
jgi:gas vesicle protein